MAKRDMELIYELGSIRNIPRAWKQIFHADFANLAEHHFRVAWIAMLLAKYEGKGDTGKIVTMALVHDIAESRTGDAHAIARQYTKRNEVLAAHDMLKDTSLEKDMLKIWEEYEALETIEAKLVKDADWLDVDFEMMEQITKGHESLKVWVPQRRLVYKNLHTKSGKQMWKKIHNSNPNSWFLNARSRFNDGDMKPIKKIEKKEKT